MDNTGGEQQKKNETNNFFYVLLFSQEGCHGLDASPRMTAPESNIIFLAREALNKSLEFETFVRNFDIRKLKLLKL